MIEELPASRPSIADMETRLPLSALLSQALVAFTIEFDNEFEHRVPHRATRHGSTTGSRSAPWLVSMVLWQKFMQFVPAQGISTGGLYDLTSCTRKEFQTLLTRMSKWWGYVSVKTHPIAEPGKLGSAMLVLPTAGGQKALQAWQPLTGILEERWNDRFGRARIAQLCASLHQLANKLSADLPDSLPILGFDMMSNAPNRAPANDHNSSPLAPTLPVLFSKVLLAFVSEFERETGMSLAICANVVRLVGEDGVRVRDLPRLSGVSKEAIAMALKRLEISGLASLQPEQSGSRVKIVMLTPAGQRVQESYRESAHKIEERWQTSCGKHAIDALRSLLEQFVGEPSAGRSPLLQGLQPYPDCWRASLPQLEVLAHYPMILHRGGFPDGS
jgi:DNA-binding MarR family transcriptional regulator